MGYHARAQASPSKKGRLVAKLVKQLRGRNAIFFMIGAVMTVAVVPHFLSGRVQPEHSKAIILGDASDILNSAGSRESSTTSRRLGSKDTGQDAKHGIHSSSSNHLSKDSKAQTSSGSKGVDQAAVNQGVKNISEAVSGKPPATPWYTRWGAGL